MDAGVKMANSDFYDLIFADYWEQIDRSDLIQDPQSMFGDSDTIEWLLNVVRPKTVVEVGSWKGHSANFIADVCRKLDLQTKIVCIDTFLGAVEHYTIPGSLQNLHMKNGRPTILERFQGNTIARGNEDMVFPFAMDSANAAQLMREKEFRADLIYIDAAHDYDDVVADIKNFWPLVGSQGVMFGDDYQFGPLCQAVHDMAEALHVPVVVSERKWIFVTPRLARHLLPPGFEIRTSGEGWIHP